MTVKNYTRAIVPMKPAYDGKARLAGVLESEDRAALCLLLLQHVLSVLAETTTLPETWVVGGDKWVRSVATQELARWQVDPGGGLNDAVRQAAEKAFQEGASAILVLPGDLGLLRPEDVDHLVDLSSDLRRAVLVRAATDGGTNAILAPRGSFAGPLFGPDSFRRHLEATQEANISVEVQLTGTVSFDLDTPEDLSVYRQRRPDFAQDLASWRRKLRSPASVAGSGQ